MKIQKISIVRSGDAIYVRVGDYDLTRKYGSPGAQTLRVATTYIHHNHNSQTLDNDIALLKLNGQAELREGVCLVCLPGKLPNAFNSHWKIIDFYRRFFCYSARCQPCSWKKMYSHGLWLHG